MNRTCLIRHSDTLSADTDPLRIVGGTFTLKGVTSPLQFTALCTILRVSIYTYLSLLLEQHFLVNSGVELNFPQRKNIPLIPSPSLPGAFKLGKRDPPENKQSFHAFSGTGILSYLSRKTAHVLHRTTSLGPILGQGDPLDLAASYVDASGGPNIPARPTAVEGIGERLRRFSFPLKSDLTAGRSSERPLMPFSTTLEEIEKWKGLLSTSASVSFAPPILISKLAEKEKQVTALGPRGDEKIGLTTLLGCEGEGSLPKGMVGVAGFVRHQQLSLLYSQLVPSKGRPGPQAPSGSKAPNSSSMSSLSPSANSMSHESFPCHRPRCITFRYYSRGQDADRPLGEIISELCTRTEEPCDTPDCQYKRRQHQFRFIHNGMKIAFDSDASAEDDNSTALANRGDAEKILMWQSCKVCKERTEKQFMNDGT
jgi:1-phosphatidylinositol-3-phosphate 5-kinase